MGSLDRAHAAAPPALAHRESSNERAHLGAPSQDLAVGHDAGPDPRRRERRGARPHALRREGGGACEQCDDAMHDGRRVDGVEGALHAEVGCNNQSWVPGTADFAVCRLV